MTLLRNYYAIEIGEFGKALTEFLYESKMMRADESLKMS